MSAVPQCPPVPSPSLASGLLDSWLDGAAATFEGLGKCWAAALQRGPVALDVPRWMLTASTRQAPAWTTPHTIVFETPLAAVEASEYFRANSAKSALRFFKGCVLMFHRTPTPKSL